MHRLTPWLEVVVARRMQVLVATDFDGTIAPIVADASRALPDVRAVELLDRLAQTPGVRVALLTGRGLEDAAVRLRGLRRAWIGAEHGSVLLDPAGDVTSDEPVVDVAKLAALAVRAAEISLDTPGAWIEPKPGAVALHLRGVPAHAVERLSERFRAVASVAGARLLEGRSVLEARFRRGDKGTALRALVADRAAETAVIYAGDDLTDEAAFAFVRALPHGLAYHVASEERPAATHAHAALPSQAAWIHVLGIIVEALHARTVAAA